MSLPKCMDFTDYNKYPGEDNPTTDAQMQDFMLNQNLLVKAVAAKMWQPSTEYAVGEVITSPSMPAGTEAVCTGAGTSGTALEPEWTMNTSIPDGSCFWQLRYVHYTESLATDDEAIAGEDGEKVVTPSAMKAAIDAILAELDVGVTSVNGSTGDVDIKDYVSNIEVSGKTITVTFKDGTTKTLTTQDTGITLSSSITVTASTQSAITPTAKVYDYGDGTNTAYDGYISKMPTVVAGIAAGSYTIQNIIQQLVNKSHTHSSKTLNLVRNSNCTNCSNACNDCH